MQILSLVLLHNQRGGPWEMLLALELSLKNFGVCGSTMIITHLVKSGVYLVAMREYNIYVRSFMYLLGS